MGERHDSPLRPIILVSSFFLKEVRTVFRQPQLLIGFVIGPFLILAAFGIGYKGGLPERRVALVVPANPAIPDDPAAYDRLFGSAFTLASVTRDRAAAEADLAAGRIQVVLIAPADAEADLRAGRHSQFTLLYTETDPLQAGWVTFFANVGIQELNQRVLTTLVGSLGRRIGDLRDRIGDLDARLGELREALIRGDEPAARDRLAASRQALDAVGASPSVALVSTLVDPQVELLGGPAVDPLAPARLELNAIEAGLDAGRVDTPDQIARADRLNAQADALHAQTVNLTRVPADVLTAPFTVESRNILAVPPTVIAFYAPVVVGLLLQHSALSLISISLVRERLFGALEVYQVAPIGAREIILGKSLGYGLLLGLVAALLVALVVYLLGVPLVGAAGWVAVALALLIVASLGLGLWLATLARSEMQAVQLAMLVLLASIVFGGFLLSPAELIAPVRVISYLVPLTYAGAALRDVMLRGAAPEWWQILGPIVLAIVFYALAARGLRRELSAE